MKDGLYLVKNGEIYSIDPRIRIPIAKSVNIKTGEVRYATNADRIRAMSDEELAEFLYGIDFKYWDGILPVITIDGQDILDENEMYEWLKTEVDGGKD